MLAVAALLTAGCAGTSASSSLRARLLTVADLPAGWSAAATNPQTVQLSGSRCFTSLSGHPKGLAYETAAFVQGTSIPNVGEVLATGPQVRATWQRLNRSLADCSAATLSIAGKKVRASIRPLTLPVSAPASAAYTWTFTYAGIHFGVDLILFQTGRYDGYLSYADLDTPPIATVTAFASAAVRKVEGRSTGPISDTLSVTSTPVRTIRTTRGTVAYRTLGTGSALVLITGYAGTMNVWDRRFVDALAQQHQVVLFDNAGVGRTQNLPAPLTIDAMADQTSALIAALNLARPDVLGWSMGSMIAQALAVLHPNQVHRLILCAGYPGTGEAVPPSRTILDKFEHGSEQQVLAELFPADQIAAQNTYLAAISSYPNAPAVPTAVVNAQGRAVDQWWAGQDPAGRRAADISATTLIADGTEDRLDPLVNSQRLAALIPHATLKLYPDAGHDFLFQEENGVTMLIDSFLR